MNAAAWIHLLVASVFEVTWAVGLKYAAGFTRFWPSVVTIAGALASFYFLALAARTLPLGTAYAVWTGIGAAGTAIWGLAFFGEPRAFLRMLGIGLVVGGVIILKIGSRE
jgi:quaternary ammonium compound-resistance protein SugE